MPGSALSCGRRPHSRKPDEYEMVDEWVYYPGKIVCRIWEWWRPRVDGFMTLSFVLRHVVLTQLSSYYVE